MCPTVIANVCDMLSLVTRFMGSTWGPSGADRTQVGPCSPHELCYMGCFVSVILYLGLWDLFTITVRIDSLIPRQSYDSPSTNKLIGTDWYQTIINRLILNHNKTQQSANRIENPWGNCSDFDGRFTLYFLMVQAMNFYQNITDIKWKSPRTLLYINHSTMAIRLKKHSQIWIIIIRQYSVAS